MKLTEEQYQVLARNEQHLSSAYNSWWVRNLLPEEARALRAIDVELNGDKEPFSPSCGTCILRICRRLAPLYYADREERNTPKVEETPKKAERKKKVKVNA